MLVERNGVQGENKGPVWLQDRFASTVSVSGLDCVLQGNIYARLVSKRTSEAQQVQCMPFALLRKPQQDLQKE